MKKEHYLCVILVLIAILTMPLLFKNNNGRYSMAVTNGGGIIVFDTRTGEMEGCLSKDHAFENILNCKKMVKLDG